MSNIAPITRPPEDRTRVARAVRAHLAVAEISASKMGVMVGISQSGMSRRTKGLLPFDIDELSSIARTLGKSLEELIAMPREGDSGANTRTSDYKAPVVELDSRRRRAGLVSA